MKTQFRFLLSLAVIFSLGYFASCTKTDDEGLGTFEFSMSLPDDISATKSGDEPVAAYHLIVSVQDPRGNPVLTDKMVPVYKFGTGYVSGKVELKNGEYKLVKLMLVNTEGTVLSAAPLEGSPNAYLVKKPLPVGFNIVPDRVTTLNPEMLAVGNQSPSAFGYAQFGVVVIKPLDFWVVAVKGFSNPEIMAPVSIIEAKLTVSNNTGWTYAFKLAAAPNHLVIRGGSEAYTLVLEAEGLPAKKFQFTAAQLMNTTQERPLYLNIIQEPAPLTMSFQPGPDLGKDAMISNLEPDKNFGGHKYFEATFLTAESQLTVMNSKRSLIFFDMSALPAGAKITKAFLRLVYEKPIPFDDKLFPTVQPAAGITWYGAVLQQIIEPWEENGVTWNKQPKTMDANQVFIPPFIRNTNVIELDVTRLLVSTFEKPAPNHGMLFRLWPEDKFPGFRFASSDYPEPSWRPKLHVQYTKGK